MPKIVATHRPAYANTGSIKFVLFAGISAFILLGLTAVGLRSIGSPDQSQRAHAGSARSPFDGVAAFETLTRICAFGPRPSNSAPLAQTRALIVDELESAGLNTWTHEFDADTPIGMVPMVNVVGEIKGDKPGVIVVSGHYDTKLMEDIRFIGANDGGSSTAWLIEMARAIGPKREGRTVWLVFFDGEEAFGEWSDDNGIFGSRAFVEHLKAKGDIRRIDAALNVDMIGDCYLGVQRDTAAPSWMQTAVWGKAEELGYAGHFLHDGSAITDDHIPFRLAGIPAMNLIDFQYGGSVVDHRRNWHTENDTLDKCCAESLQIVGDVVYHALPSLETYLDAGLGN
jgi:glutaminyl-peptide cyclotransferase